MAQGYTGYNIIDNEITIKDGPNLDAFSRLRVSNPLTIFSNQFTYDLSPLIFEEYTNNISSCSVIYDSINRLSKIQMSGAVIGDFIYMQSYEYIPYQPGRSQLVFITFSLEPTGSGFGSDVNRYVGLGDDDNGFFFRWNGVTGRPEFMIRTTTFLGTQIVPDTGWNLDRLNGLGASGKTIDYRRTQILVIDFQALYVGRVRFGFDIDGEIIYAHEFLNANTHANPYIASANLPIRVGLEAINGTLAEEIDFICCSVASEGGLDDSQRFGYNFSITGSKLTLASTLSYITSIRPITTFNSITNRTKFILDSIEITNTGNRTAYYELGIGAVINTPTYNPCNSTYSAFEVDTSGSSASSPTLIFDSGHIPSGGGSKNVAISNSINSKYPITLDAAGTPRDLGTLYLYANGITGTTDIYYAIRWKEIR